MPFYASRPSRYGFRDGRAAGGFCALRNWVHFVSALVFLLTRTRPVMYLRAPDLAIVTNVEHVLHAFSACGVHIEHRAGPAARC